MEAVIQALNTHHNALIPFTVDHLGGIGHFAAALFFYPRISPLAPPRPTPISAYNSRHPQPPQPMTLCSPLLSMWPPMQTVNG
jgi:hypothetical protein